MDSGVPEDRLSRPKWASLLPLAALGDFLASVTTLSGFPHTAICWLALLRGIAVGLVGASAAVRQLYAVVGAVCLAPLIAACYSLNATIQHRTHDTSYSDGHPHIDSLSLQLALSIGEWLLYVCVVGISRSTTAQRRRRSSVLRARALSPAFAPQDAIASDVDEEALVDDEAESEFDEDELIDMPDEEGTSVLNGNSPTGSLGHWRLGTPTRSLRHRPSFPTRTSSGYGTM